MGIKLEKQNLNAGLKHKVSTKLSALPQKPEKIGCNPKGTVLSLKVHRAMVPSLSHQLGIIEFRWII